MVNQKNVVFVETKYIRICTIPEALKVERLIVYNEHESDQLIMQKLITNSVRIHLDDDSYTAVKCFIICTVFYTMHYLETTLDIIIELHKFNHS